ncbi:unnamed protein product [Adineta ricciae]|uniref:Uncharacterized protein n=1 Tax=Adineta ricciae TaxID=249248 RepID=A0A814B9V3_ADIRI|nr:unnamed protein product [Adineta ricciae]CAF1023022.1 unnamed protein product [Adineta ricciae]
MLAISTIFLLFLCTNTNAHTNDDRPNFYPPLWHLVPSSIDEFPLINESVVQYRLIDPWFYPHRLGLFKILVNVTTPYMPFCSSSNASNILFALPSQFGWLFSSNRLFTNGTMYMSTDSWWASANYYLSVVPFLAAVDVGLIEKATFRIIQQENFCSNSAQCFQQIPNAMNQWHLFFRRLRHPESCTAKKKLTPRTIDECYLEPIWSAYKMSIYDSLPLVESKLQYLPSEVEKMFGLGWARLLHLISMTRKNTNLYETLKNQRKFLPFRMLTSLDRAADSNDFPDSVNHSLKILLTLRFDWLSFIEYFWQKLTCTYEGRVYAQQILEVMSVSKLLAFHYLVKASINALIEKCESVPHV